MLVGLVSGLAVNAAPFPRLMLTAHIQFLVNGMVSVFAGLLFWTGLAIVRRPAGLFIVGARVSTWLVCLSEVAAAWWGARNALPIAASLAAAPGATSWQESLVLACHMIPALLLIAAWALLVQGIYKALLQFREDAGEP